MQISCDAISESKSTSISIDVYSLRFKNCKVVYPLRLVRPVKKKSIDNKKQFKLFINDILSCEGSRITEYCADNLKRATGRDCLNHASTYPCEYCFNKGVRSQSKNFSSKTKTLLASVRKKLTKVTEESNGIEKIKSELNKAENMIAKSSRTNLVWPSSTSQENPRTNESMLKIIEKIEEKGKLPPHEAKGVVGRSPLFEIPHFNFVRDSPTEYMHSVCLGMTKRMLECTFEVGVNRDRNTKRKLSKASDFNVLMQDVKVFHECSRRYRELDFAVMKAQEFRNVTILFFPLVVQCIEPKEKERKLWLLFAYVIRSSVLSSEEYKAIDLDEIRELCAQFYVLYERLFGQNNCTYNTHVVMAHLLEMRAHGPLTETSAFGFESFYGEIRHSFVPGTQSTLKQILKKILLKRIVNNHRCENSIFFSDHETALENNTLVYCYTDMTFHIFKVVEIRGNSLFCNKQGKFKATFPELSSVSWSKVGVFRKGPISNDLMIIPKEKVSGKVIEVQNLLITCPNNVLREK